MFMIVSKWFWFFGIDDNGIVYFFLFLQIGMVVVLVSFVLFNFKGVNVGIIRFYVYKIQFWNIIYIGWKNNVVLVNGCLFIKMVFDFQGNGVIFFLVKNGFWQVFIDCFGLMFIVCDIDGCFINGQVKLSILQGCGNWQVQIGMCIEILYVKIFGYVREG